MRIKTSGKKRSKSSLEICRSRMFLRHQICQSSKKSVGWMSYPWSQEMCTLTFSYFLLCLHEADYASAVIKGKRYPIHCIDIGPLTAEKLNGVMHKKWNHDKNERSFSEEEYHQGKTYFHESLFKADYEIAPSILALSRTPMHRIWALWIANFEIAISVWWKSQTPHSEAWCSRIAKCWDCILKTAISSDYPLFWRMPIKPLFFL